MSWARGRSDGGRPQRDGPASKRLADRNASGRARHAGSASPASCNHRTRPESSLPTGDSPIQKRTRHADSPQITPVYGRGVIEAVAFALVFIIAGGTHAAHARAFNNNIVIAGHHRRLQEAMAVEGEGGMLIVDESDSHLPPLTLPRRLRRSELGSHGHVSLAFAPLGSRLETLRCEHGTVRASARK